MPIDLIYTWANIKSIHRFVIAYIWWPKLLTRILTNEKIGNCLLYWEDSNQIRTEQWIENVKIPDNSPSLPNTYTSNKKVLKLVRWQHAEITTCSMIQLFPSVRTHTARLLFCTNDSKWIRLPFAPKPTAKN